MHKFFKRLSLKYQYLLSTFGVALIACSVIGLLLYFSSAHELRKINEEQIINRLPIFAEELEIQKDIMEDVAYAISNRIYLVLILLKLFS